MVSQQGRAVVAEPGSILADHATGSTSAKHGRAGAAPNGRGIWNTVVEVDREPLWPHAGSRAMATVRETVTGATDSSAQYRKNQSTMPSCCESSYGSPAVLEGYTSQVRHSTKVTELR